MDKSNSFPFNPIYNLAVSPLQKDSFLDRIEEVLVALRRVIRATDLHSKHLAKTTGLTAPQILLLQTIRDKDQATIGEIAGEISLSQATVTRSHSVRGARPGNWWDARVGVKVDRRSGSIGAWEAGEAPELRRVAQTGKAPLVLDLDDGLQ